MIDKSKPEQHIGDNNKTEYRLKITKSSTTRNLDKQVTEVGNKLVLEPLNS